MTVAMELDTGYTHTHSIYQIKCHSDKLTTIHLLVTENVRHTVCNRCVTTTTAREEEKKREEFSPKSNRKIQSEHYIRELFTVPFQQRKTTMTFFAIVFP